jgi:hypothetical protein
MVWFVVAMIIICTAMAMIVAALIRDRRLERIVRVEITNQGNVSSRYQLRAQDPEGVLSATFMKDGDPLPGLDFFVDDPEDQEPEQEQEVPTEAEKPQKSPASAATDTVAEAQQASGALARMLSSLGSILPRSIGSPLLSAASQLQQKRGQVRRVQSYSKKGSSLGRKLGTRPSEPQEKQPLRPAGPQAWSETPSVQPGYTLALDLVLRSVGSHEHSARPFRVISRSVTGAEAPLITEEGTVEIKGGFWARRYLPHVVLLVVGAALLALAAWLASAGVL